VQVDDIDELHHPVVDQVVLPVYPVLEHRVVVLVAMKEVHVLEEVLGYPTVLL
jgi:hypothetical protein